MRVRYVLTRGGRLAAVVEGGEGLTGIGAIGLAGIGANGRALKRLRSFGKKVAKSKAFQALKRVAVMAADASSGGAASRALEVARQAEQRSGSLANAVRRDLQRMPAALRPAAREILEQARTLAPASSLANVPVALSSAAAPAASRPVAPSAPAAARAPAPVLAAPEEGFDEDIDDSGDEFDEGID